MMIEPVHKRARLATGSGQSAAQVLLACASRTLILDGAMGTELARVGATSMGKPGWTVRPHMTADGRAAIKAVHRSYLEAGADVICTHTYNLCELYCTTNGLTVDDIPAAQRLAVQLGREAMLEYSSSNRRPVLAAVLGPYGAAAEQGGDYDFDYGKVDEETLKDFHRRRAAVLSTAGPDVLLFETIPSLKELKAIVAVLDELGLSGWVSFALSAEAAGLTAAGDSWVEVIRLADVTSSVQAIGVNCARPQRCFEGLQEARALTEKPLLAYPNNGFWDKENNKWRSGSPEEFSKCCDDIATIARVIGGCCCTGPEEIRALRNSVMLKGAE